MSLYGLKVEMYLLFWNRQKKKCNSNFGMEGVIAKGDGIYYVSRLDKVKQCTFGSLVDNPMEQMQRACKNMRE